MSVAGTNPGGNYTDDCLEYDGSSWTANPNAFPATNFGLWGTGTATAALIFGGRLSPGSLSAEAYTFNGTSFSAVNDMNTARYYHAGAGTSTSAALNSNDIDITVNNTDRGSAQLFYKTFTADSGSNAVASANNDTIDIEGGNAISTVGSADKITINHSDTSSQASVNNSADAASFESTNAVAANFHIPFLFAKNLTFIII